MITLRCLPGLFLPAFLLLAATPALPAQPADVLTYHNDNARTGQYLTETSLTPANVNPTNFGKLWVLPADGHVDGEPLYAANVPIPGKGLRNVVFIVTEHDTVYAYDADSTNLFWSTTMLASGEASAKNGCSQVSPEVGITGAPVIDRQLGPSGTIFMCAMSLNGSTYFQRLHALDLATGTNRLPAATITGSYPGTGSNSVSGRVIFDPKQYEDRAGLLLINGVVYTAWASHCDIDPYTGWIMGYDERTLVQTNLLNVTPNGGRGAIWMGNSAMAGDAGGNIFLLDANGIFDPTVDANGFPGNGDYGNAFLKLSTSNNVLAVADYFATYDTISRSAADGDLGSGGAIVLPDMVDTNGVTRHLAVGAGKDRNIYIADLANMGKFNLANNNALYQEVNTPLGSSCFSMPAYFNSTLYYTANGDRLRAFPFKNARLGAQSSQSSASFGTGATPSISANGTNNGIVWESVDNDGQTAVLHAYPATNLTVEIYNTSMAAANRDNYGTGVKYATVMVAHGRVYSGISGGVGVFGLLDQAAITGITVTTNGAVTMNYATTSGLKYHLEVTTNLAAPGLAARSRRHQPRHRLRHRLYRHHTRCRQYPALLPHRFAVTGARGGWRLSGR